jgi:hypothetical protein
MPQGPDKSSLALKGLAVMLLTLALEVADLSQQPIIVQVLP